LVILCGFQCVEDACHKTRHPSITEGFPYTRPTSAYSGHYPRPLLLGASYSATAYGLAAFFLQRAIAGFPVPGVPCFVTLGWCFTPCPFEWLPCADVRHGLNTVPFGLACQPLWQVVHDDASITPSFVIHSHLLDGIVASVCDLPPFLPASDPRLPNARLGMVLLLHHLESKTFTYRDTQLSRYDDLAAHPLYFTVQFRANGSHTPRPQKPAHQTRQLEPVSDRQNCSPAAKSGPGVKIPAKSDGKLNANKAFSA
jgi:hypothetical protein